MASGLTTTYLLPYPLQTDPVDVASDVQDLAEAVETELLLKAPLASPTFTGTPAAPTAASDTSTTQIATTQFVVNQGYLKESIATTTYAPLDSAPLTGTPTAPTAPLGTNTTQIATTGYVQNELDNFVTLPEQTTHSGKFLTTNGTAASWQQISQSDVDGLPAVLDSLPDEYAQKYIEISFSSVSPTFSLTDAGKLYIMQNSLSTPIQLPNDSTINFPVGTNLSFVRTNGVLTVSVESGGTLLATPGNELRAVGSFATAIKYSANSWILTGDLIA